MSTVDELRDTDQRHAAEGVWFRFRCWKCDEITDVEHDPRSEVIECEACGAEGVIEGDY